MSVPASMIPISTSLFVYPRLGERSETPCAVSVCLFPIGREREREFESTATTPWNEEG